MAEGVFGKNAFSPVATVHHCAAMAVSTPPASPPAGPPPLPMLDKEDPRCPAAFPLSSSGLAPLETLA